MEVGRWLPWVAVAGLIVGYAGLVRRTSDAEAQHQKREQELENEVRRLAKAQRSTEGLARGTLSRLQAAAANGTAQAQTTTAALAEGSGKADTEEAKTEEPLNEEEEKQRFDEERRQMFAKVSEATRTRHAEPGWVRSIQAGVDEIVTSGKTRAGELHCGGPFCMLTIQASDHALFARPGTGLASKLVPNAEYVGYRDRGDGTIEVSIAQRALDLGTL